MTTAIVYDFVSDGLSEQDLFLLAVKFEALRIALDIEDEAQRKSIIVALLKQGPFAQAVQEPGGAGAEDEETEQTDTDPTSQEIKSTHLNQSNIDETLSSERLVDDYINQVQAHPFHIRNAMFYATTSRGNKHYFAKKLRAHKLSTLREAAEIGYMSKRNTSSFPFTYANYYPNLNDSLVSARAKSVICTLLAVGLLYTASILLAMDFDAKNVAKAAGKIFGFFTLMAFLMDSKNKFPVFTELFVRPFVVGGIAKANEESYATRTGYFNQYVQNKPVTADTLMQARSNIDLPEKEAERAPLLVN